MGGRLNRSASPDPPSPGIASATGEVAFGIIGHVYVHRPKLLPMPPALQRYLSLYANYAGLL